MGSSAQSSAGIDHVGGALAAEDLERVELRLGRHARADVHGRQLGGVEAPVGAGERVVGRVTPKPAVVPATCVPCPSQSSGLGSAAGRRVGRVGVVVVAGEVVAADDLGLAEGGRLARQLEAVEPACAASYAAAVPAPPKSAWV